MIYGILILGSGIYGLFHPPRREVALGYLHAEIWWGALLLVLGVIYALRFNPLKDSYDDDTSHGQGRSEKG